ncbi:DnaJ family domain-containing protein [Bacillus swezeyi]|uniref:DnaJ family domain-containing protein n=1 Tax=Bacillus swezeyi TaxID=1925020 RepID=UPI003F8CB36C
MSKENDKRYIHWIDQAVKDGLDKDGGIQSLPGFGKPLSKEALHGNALSSTLKNARYLPDWLRLQKDIKQEIEKAITSKQGEEQIDLINRKIKKYNLSCPSQFQKSFVTKQNLENQLKHWS